MKKLFMIAALVGMVFTASAQEKKDETKPQSEAVAQIRLAK